MSKKRKPRTFKERLAEKIAQDGRSITSIAATVGVSPQYLSMAQSPKRYHGATVDKSVDFCRRLAKALGCPIEELLGL